MKRSMTLPFMALVVLAGVTAPACAGAISGTVSGITTITPTNAPNVFIQDLTGEGNDTVLGSFSMQSQSTVDFNNPLDIIISNGMCSQTFSEGTLTGICYGSGTTTGVGTGTFTTFIVFTGGTGLFAGATGGMTVTGTEMTTGPTTGTITASYVGTLSSVPEPGSLALLASAVAIGAIVLVRGKSSKGTIH
jgi:hypothetical protein